MKFLKKLFFSNTTSNDDTDLEEEYIDPDTYDRYDLFAKTLTGEYLFCGTTDNWEDVIWYCENFLIKNKDVCSINVLDLKAEDDKPNDYVMYLGKKGILEFDASRQ